MTVADTNKINGLADVGESVASAMTLDLAGCLRDYVDEYGEKNQYFLALRALATLTISRVKEGKDDLRFTALNIVTEADISVREGMSAGTRLGPIWKTLMEIKLKGREKGIQDFARYCGLERYPWPEKNKSDGGATSDFYLISKQLPATDGLTLSRVELDEIAYIHELTPDPSWWAKPLIKNGYRLVGWRRGLVMVYGMALFIACSLSIALGLWILLGQLPALRAREAAKAVFALVIIIAALYLALTPLVRLFNWRIIMAPTNLIAFKELNVQLEIFREPHSAHESPGTIRLIRYAGTCPVCRAKVELAEGRKEFPNRLIGRCRENPAEHVYSFDRFTCRGKKLR